MHRRPALALPVLALALLTACTGGGGGGPAALPPAGAPAPDIALPDLDGTTVRLSDFDGKVRLVDFWATWCAPCKEEIPMFKELQATYGPRGFELIAICVDSGDASVVKPFVQQMQIPYVNLIGDDATKEAFGGVVGLPTAFLIDRQGRLVGAPFTGPKPRKVLEERIEALLAQGEAK